jgi:branched-chain amino acid transport system substrate-binding protein
MRRLVVAGMMAVTAVLAAPAAAMSPGAGARDPSIVVGIIATLTGPGAIAGQDMVDGFNVALKQLGGRFANQEVRVVVADDKGSADFALQQVRRLMERERLDIVLTGTSPAALAAILRPLIAARLFVFNLDGEPESLAGAECSSWVFDIGSPVNGLYESLGIHLAAEKMQRIVLVGPDLPPLSEAETALRRTFSGAVKVLRVKPGSSLYRDEVERIAALRPDAVVSVLSGGMGVAFLRSWGESGLKSDIPLYALWRSLERPVLPALGDGALDLFSIATWSPDLDNPVNRRMQSDFDIEYGRPSTGWSARGYDAALLLDSALRATGGRTADSDALRAAIRKAEFTSVRGGFRFNVNHTPVQSYYLRKVVRDAKGRLTNEVRQVVVRDWRDRHSHGCPMHWEDEHAPPPLPAKKP